jgi:cyanophycinase
MPQQTRQGDQGSVDPELVGRPRDLRIGCGVALPPVRGGSRGGACARPAGFPEDAPEPMSTTRPYPDVPDRSERGEPHVTVSGQHRIRADEPRGTLVLIGGACNPTGSALAAFLDAADAHEGGRIIGVTEASDDPAESARGWIEDLRAAGATNVAIPELRRGDAAQDREIAAMIAEADGVLLGDGDQVKLVDALSGTATGRAIRAAHAAGAAVCGTGAGAAALTELTVARGEIDVEGNLVEQYIGPGLGLLGFDAIIDTHLGERRRLQRLFLVVAEHPRLLGLGIDEDTALVVRGHVGRVVGAGGVTFVDGRTSMHFDNARRLDVGRQLTVSCLRVGIVGTHYELNLPERELELLVRQGKLPYEDGVAGGPDGDRRESPVRAER